MTIQLDEVLRRVAEPGGLERLVAELRPAVESAVLQRCAVARTFDRAMYDNVIAPDVTRAGLTAPPLENVIRWSEVQTLGADIYAVRGRTDLLRGWSDPVKLAAFRRQVVIECDARGTAGLDEKLEQWFALNHAEAGALFSSAYASADERHDLGRAQELIERALEYRPYVSTKTRETIDEHRSLFRARGLWKDDYYKSLLYQPREKIDAYLEQFLQPDAPKWIGNLFAKGGMGKTASLQALIAQKCVKARVPVGRVDFGFVDPRWRPERIVLKIVSEFDDQMPGSPFGEVRTFFARQERSTSTPSYNDKKVLRYARIFGSILEDVRPDRPSLAIFDNMEDAIIARADIAGIFHWFAEAHAEAPALRLLLSGRYSLFDRPDVPGLEPFEEQTDSFEVDRFDDRDATAYLVDRRGLPDTPGLKKIIAASDGVPFKLSLFADLLRDEAALSIDELVAGGSVEVTYLIVRIVRRLEPRLQWVLRYGVVPRRLTREFVRDVMYGTLVKAMSGDRDLDDPVSDLPPILQKDVFAPQALKPAAVTELWESLSRYAAERSWVSRDNSQPDTLFFHDEVRRPMLRLLRNKKAFQALHRAAADHYQRTGNEREAVYHLFQLRDPGAETYWRNALDLAQRDEQIDRVIELAGALLIEDFIDGNKPVADEHGNDLVPRPVLARALLTVAFASLRSAREGGADHPGWRTANDAANRARVLGANDSMPDELAMVEAAILLNAGDPARVVDRLSAIRPSNRSQRLGLSVISGIAEAMLGNPVDAIQPLVEAAKLAFSRGARAGMKLLDWSWASIEPTLVQTLTSQYALLGDYTRALETLNNGIDRATKDGRSAQVAEYQLRLAALQNELRIPSAAIQTLDSVKGVDYRLRGMMLRAEAHWLRYEAFEALDLCAAAERIAMESTVPDFAQVARATELRARIHASMLEIADARTHFERAYSYWLEAATRNAANRSGPAACLAMQAETEYFEFGDLEHARQRIERIEAGPVDGRDAAVTFTAAAIRRLLDGSDEPLPPPKTPRQRVAEAVLGGDALAIREAFTAITPPPARLAVLDWLRRLPELTSREHQSILRLLPDPKSRGEVWRECDKDDLARLAMERAQACTFFGRSAEGRASLKWAAKRLQSPERPLFDHVLLRAEAKFGIKRDTKSVERRRDQLAVKNPDFLAALLWDAAAVQRTSSQAERLRGLAADAAHSPEVKTWIAAHAPASSKTVMVAPTPSLSRPGEVSIEIELRDSIRMRIRTPDDAWTMMSPPRASLLFDDEEAVSYAALKHFVSDPDGFKRLLRDVLDDGSLWAYLKKSASRFDVRLELSEPRAHSIPWELAFQANHHVRSVYRATGGSAWRVPARRRDPSILVVRRSLKTELTVQRGAAFSSTHGSAEHQYERAGFSVGVVEDPTTDDLLSIAGNQQPDLIHVSSSFGEAPEAGVVLEFANRDLELAGAAPTSVPASLFARFIAPNSGREEAPAIVLDVTSAPQPTEMTRQMMLRNVFAAELAQSGVFSAILAIGPLQPWAFDPIEAIAQGLAGGLRYGEIVRRLGNDDESSALCAFFCEWPETEDSP